MKTKAIFLASALLVGCQISGPGAPVSVDQSQDRSTADQKSEPEKYTDNRHIQFWSKKPAAVTRSDLWNFIGDELKMNVPENTRIREQKHNILKNKRWLHNTVSRAEPYLHWVVDQIRQRNMPMELVLLPIMESTFDPQATSSSDATGLWQIVPGTARNYGLKKNQWYDGRRDVAASTGAALDMLAHLNVMFDGDWLLTIAAYNGGEGRVMRAVKDNKKKGKLTHFWALSLPRETAVYVPKMLALGNIIKHSKQNGVNLPPPDADRALAQIEVSQRIHLSQVAKMAGIPLKQVKSYNSGYTRNITEPDGPHYIMLPRAHVGRFQDSLAAVVRKNLPPRSTKAI